MIRRPLRPHFGTDDEKTLIRALGEARNWVVKCEAGHEIKSPLRPKCDALARAIDDLVEELTGDRTLFHAKMANTGQHGPQG